VRVGRSPIQLAEQVALQVQTIDAVAARHVDPQVVPDAHDAGRLVARGRGGLDLRLILPGPTGRRRFSRGGVSCDRSCCLSRRGGAS